MISEFDKIKEEVVGHFNLIYSEDYTDQAHESQSSMDLVPNLLQRQDNLNLTKPITLKEVKTTVEDMEENKVARPDGFTTRFLKFC